MRLKKEIRKKIIKKRNELSFAEIEEKSKAVEALLFQQDFYKKSQTILFYASFNSEVKTDEIIKQAINDGKTVSLPIVINEEKKLEIKNILDLTNLEISPFGIREPNNSLPNVSPADLDLVVIPCCCLDKRGNRIGYGGGYYDRFLASLSSGVFKVALAYEIQIIDELPCEDHDFPVDAIITEKGVYRFKNRE